MPDERRLASSMLTGATPPMTVALAMAHLPAEVLHGAVVRAGAPALGVLLRHLPDRAAAGICGRLPEALREDTWRSRRGGVAPFELSPPKRMDLLRLHAEAGAADAARLVFTLGARPMAAFLRHHAPLALRQVAQGLPVPVGRILLDTPLEAPPPSLFVIDCLVRAAAG